ncbi:ABC transporter permease [Nonomuraea sp. AD125B]|jgi:ABC-2 type transport system permease protein|uniref:ABC transporter permease n=1 Tax=Nonomuraea TaxID=83681 RepID=UPI0031CF51E0
MTTIDEARAATPRPPVARSFAAILTRDLVVTWRELPAFLTQVVLQPLFILFVFGTVLGDLGYVGGDFGAVLLPGVIALNAFVGGLQNTALPLTLDFSYSREIEDRLLAPLPIWLVAVEKMLFGTVRGLLAGAVMIPLGLLVLPGTEIALASVPPALLVMALGAFVGSAIGMTLGTAVSPRGINTVFAAVLTPLMFTGATQFPWPELERLPWFQVVCALNPLTYVSEAMRAVMVPQIPHLAFWLCLLVMAVAGAGFAVAGALGFGRRALD